MVDTQQLPIGSGFTMRSLPAQVMAGIDLRGKTCIVTGGHGGIGLETTRALVTAGATVVIGARDPVGAGAAVAGLDRVVCLALDLADADSVDAFAGQCLRLHPTCDLLINNAGIMATPLMRDRRGNELQFATNHLGHFQLTLRLWDALAAAGNARVIALSSLGHRFAPVDLGDVNFHHRPYDPWKAYGQSKTANALFAWWCDRLGRSVGIRAFSVHPGRIPTTNLSRHMSAADRAAVLKALPVGPDPVAALLKSIPEGTSTTLWAATSPRLAGMGGVYCADCDIAPLVADDSTAANGVRRWAVDAQTAEGLWALSLDLIARRP